MTEMVDIVDKNDKVIDTVPRSVMRKDNLRYRSTYFLVFNDKDELLITKRTKNKDIDPGLYEIPGGTVDHDESYEENARREITEELCIKNPKPELLFEMKFDNDFHKHFSKVYKIKTDKDIIPQKSEIESYFFIALEDIPEWFNENKKKFCKNRVPVLEKYLNKKLA